MTVCDPTGSSKPTGDTKALYLKLFTGEVYEAFRTLHMPKTGDEPHSA